MGDVPSFTVRPLPPSAQLDGAFRTHIPPKDLEILGLRPGELCHLSAADGSSGIGIAWRSTDVNAKPHAHPVKLTDTLRDAFNFKLGNQLTIKKASGRIAHADHVVVIDVSDKDKTDPTKDDQNWNRRCGVVLGNVEAISAGVAFEASSRKGLKKRFLIENIESNDSPGGPALYYFDDRSTLVLQDEASAVTPGTPLPRSLSFSSDGIGGLHKQIELLNKRLAHLIVEMKGRKVPSQLQRNGGILLYGPSGTGKSLLLDRIAKAPWKRAVKIDQSVLSGTTSKNQTTLRSLFSDAIAHQPSLVMMDGLETIAGTQQRESLGLGSLTPALVTELDRIKNTHVLVIATTQNPNDIDKALRKPTRLRYEIEIPIPDMKSRIQILKVIQGQAGTEALAETIGERTHGFVGDDLEALFSNALEHAWDRTGDNEDWLPMQISNSDRESLRTLVNRCSLTERLAAASSDDEGVDVQVSLEDYEKALLEVRPTAMREVFLETPKVKWSDIGGSDDVATQLHEAVEWPIKYPDLMEYYGATPKKGILFYGPPGCSKTLTAKAVATSSGLNFIAVKGAELTSMYVGESERAVREVFRKARAAAPSIIFFDEIDSIGAERDSAGTKGLNVLTTLLNEMDGIESLKGVLVLAATNKPEILDPALLRPGRFDSLIYIAPPSTAARKEIMHIQTRKVPLADDVNLDELAIKTEGFSGAEVVDICNQAAYTAMRRRIAMDDGPSPDIVSKDAVQELQKVSAADFNAALSKAVRRITPEMTEGYERWRDGLTKF